MRHTSHITQQPENSRAEGSLEAHPETGHTRILGIECGGTRTVALMADETLELIHRTEAGPANVRLMSDTALQDHFQQLSSQFPLPGSLGIGMAGALGEPERERIRTAAGKAWPGIPAWVGNDLDTTLEAAGDASVTRIIIISGTGSCCYGRNAGTTAKSGGWGHLLGDRGSGYDIAMQGARAVMEHYDHTGEWPTLGARLLRSLLLNDPAQWVGWMQNAAKKDIAAMAIEVFAAWQEGDVVATPVIELAAQSLAEDAVACARKLGPAEDEVKFHLTGSVLTKQPRFAEMVTRRIQMLRPASTVQLLEREGAWGAVILAKKHTTFQVIPPSAIPQDKLPGNTGSLSPTEQRHPRTMNLDTMPISEAITVMLDEDASLPAALRAVQPELERAVQIITDALRNNGRLIYVGAGTSGRLGVLDASECPPTFRSPPEWVQGIIAGGQTALWQAAEGAEDNVQAGRDAIQFRNTGSRDVVIGIAASGRTPFVWGALQEARARKACTMLICFNPELKIPSAIRPDLIIAPAIGPEILTGSTRLKAGTATKLILNILTTLSMVQLGKVIGNLMVDLNPSNIKLRDRAIRMAMELTGHPREKVREALDESGWDVKKAITRLRQF